MKASGSLLLTLTLFCLTIFSGVRAQRIEVLSETPQLSLRGLSVVDDQVVWVSGTKGTVGKSIDGGKTWSWTTVKGFESRDFRDIEAFDKNTAVIVAVASPAYILRTTDGGTTWKQVYENKLEAMFLDAMDFLDDKHGRVIGDPIQGKIFIATTADGGVTWKELQDTPAVDEGEACFASSGTNIRKGAKGDFVFITGGKRSRIFYENQSFDIPFATGLETAGTNSFAMSPKPMKGTDRWIAVGGDFKQDTVRLKNCFISIDHGKSWITPQTPPFGYRSCVEFISESTALSCGINGVDISVDGGTTWKNISTTGFHACRKAKKGKAVFLSGGSGRIAQLTVKN